MKLPPGGSATITIDARTGAVTVEGDALEHDVAPPRYALQPVTNRGTLYQPPVSDPIAAAEQGLAFYAQFVEAAEKKFGAR